MRSKEERVNREIKGMLYIGICDDQREVALELQECVEEELKKRNVQWKSRIFLSGEELLKEAERLSIVFLDIEMPGLDGIETGKNIKQKNPNCKIIMATGMVERFKEVFLFHAFRFLVKPFSQTEIEEAIDAVLEESLGEQTIELYYERIAYQIQQKKIQYIQAFNGYSEFWIKNKLFRKDASLNELEEQLDMRLFVRVQRTYIVNLQWIEGYRKGKVLIAGKEILVSRRKKKNFEKQYITYDIHYKRGVR